MKKLITLFALGLLPATFCLGAESLTKPADSYAQAVASYVEAANREMVALHSKVEAVAKKAGDDAKSKCAEIDRQLDQCDKLLQRLTSSNRSTFDKIKSAYETARAEAIKAIDALPKVEATP